MPDLENRRPLASRQTGWAQRTATWLAGTSITPNQISQLGMLAALLAGLAFWAAGSCTGFGRVLLLLAGAGLCQIRLLCNLFDGMVAVEAQRGSPDGGFWNEFPDRVSDALILVGIGLGLGEPALGWAAKAGHKGHAGTRRARFCRCWNRSGAGMAGCCAWRCGS